LSPSSSHRRTPWDRPVPNEGEKHHPLTLSQPPLLNPVKRLAEHLFGLQRGERGTALLLAAYHFLLLLCLYLLKPARDGLFLTDRGTGELPLVFLLVAAATIPASLLQRHLGRRFRLDRLANRLTLAHAGTLVVVGTGAWWDVPGAAYAVYVYVSIYGVMATAQFWLFANGLLTSAQSKRTFAVLNLGGILGAVVGGELTGGLLQNADLAPSALLFVAAGVLTATGPLVAGIRRYRERQDGVVRADPSASAAGRHVAGGGLLERLRTTIADYPIVGWIAAIIALMSVVSTMLDYQLKTIAFAAFPGEAELTTFMGRFYGRVSVVALALQLLLTTGLRRYVRSTSVLWLLPVALALGTTTLLMVPGLVAVALLRGTDQSLKHSIDKTGRELLYVPLPQAVKRRIKVPLDLMVDQGAYGVGGLLLLGLVSGLGLGPLTLGWVVLVLVVAWIGAVAGARRAYLQQFRVSIRRSLAHTSPRSGVQSDNGQAESPPAPPYAEGDHRDAAVPLAAPEEAERALREEWGLVGEEAPSAAKRERALQHGARYLLYGQLMALRTGAAPDDTPAIPPGQLPSELALRERRQEALADLFGVLVTWLPEDQRADPDDLRLALCGLRHPSPDVRSDAVSFLDGLLSGSIRRRLVPLLDDPDGRLALRDAPPLYRFAASPRTRRYAGAAHTIARRGEQREGGRRSQ